MTSHLARLTDVVGRVCLLVDGTATSAAASAVATSVTATRAAAAAMTTPVVVDSVVPDSGTASTGTLVGSIRDLSDAQLQCLLSDAGSGRAEFDRVISIAAGEVAKRSRRELGHSGLAQQGGHRSAVQLVQVLTGESPAEARRQVRLGELLGEADADEAIANTFAGVQPANDAPAPDTPSSDTPPDDAPPDDAP